MDAFCNDSVTPAVIRPVVLFSIVCDIYCGFFVLGDLPQVHACADLYKDWKHTKPGWENVNANGFTLEVSVFMVL